MSEQSWWFVLLAFELVGLWGQLMVGSGYWWAWGVVLAHSIPWFVVSVWFARWGAALMVPCWWTVNAFNLLRWKRNRVS